MGFIEFILLCILIMVLAWGGTWVLGQVAPGHPPVVDRIIWIVAVVMIIFILIKATGIATHDPQIPRVN